MGRLIYGAIATCVNTFLLITAVDLMVIGCFSLRFSYKCGAPRFFVKKENRIDLQKGNECSGYAAAYLLRHYGIPANGTEVYQKMSHKASDGCVPPRGVKRVLEGYGLRVRYCAGNLNALKRAVSRGAPVIAFIRVRKGRRWLHFVPVTGYDEGHLFLAESLAELVNCQEQAYNRKLSTQDFLDLWNTSMLKMPLYSHTFLVAEKN